MFHESNAAVISPLGVFLGGNDLCVIVTQTPCERPRSIPFQHLDFLVPQGWQFDNGKTGN